MRKLFWSVSLIALPVLSLSAANPANAQQTTLAAPISAPAVQLGPELSVEGIMRGPELVGRAPEQVRWTPDSRWIYFRWLEPGADWREEPRPYRVRARAGAAPEPVSESHLDSVMPLLLEGAPSTDRRWRAVQHQGDLFLVDLRRGTQRRLTQTADSERAPHFDRDARQVYFLRDNNAFALRLDGGAVRQLTDVRRGPEPEQDEEAEGQRGVLERQQRELFQSVRDELRADSLRDRRRAATDPLPVDSLYLRKDERVTDLAVSPDGRALLLLTDQDAEDALGTDVPRWVTESGYTETLEVRPKVGDVQDRGRLALLRLPSGEARWLQPIAGDTAGAPALTRLIGWSETGERALVFAVSEDYKTRYLHAVSPGGELTTLDVLRDSAWVGGPCFGCAGWYDDGRRAWYVSEADGYAHLYTVAADGTDRRQLTRGEWEVLDVQLSPDERFFYLETSEASPFQRQLYRMRVGGGERTRLTQRPGGHWTTLSPDAERFADVYSYANRPPELYLQRARPGADAAQLTTSPSAQWLAFPWVAPEIVRIPASDGVGVPARIYRPEDVGAEPNGAAVLFVHGAGYLHNVHDHWSSYYREYMFHHLLAQRGYVVLDVDYRGSAGYGRDWRTAVYRHMGGRDLQDFVDASRYLQRERGIDPERVGIYGGSYGGFITLMALFTEPEWFGAGAALRSVTDWSHYNHWYTSRILNLPQADTAAYRQSSPIFFAEGLEDPLLIAHGMVDTNVHFQDVVRLTQRLIELGKTGWEMAVYPVEDHGFVRPSSWTDEYRRILELFEENLGPTAERRPVADTQPSPGR